MRLSVLALCLCVVVALPRGAAADGELPYPAGRSTQSIEGLTVELGIPEKLSKEQPASLAVILHGAGGTATGMAAALREWIPLGYVVCAPKSKGQVWSDSDVGAVKRIIAHLRKVLPLDAAKTHVLGFSNGGWNLPPLAFDDKIKPCSATWVASGCRTASPPKWAKSGLGVLALAGMQDANAASARETVTLLRDKVRTVDARFQPKLDHKWPLELMPYLRWWMGAMEGRYEPGVDMNLDWGDSIESAVKALAREKKGGIFVQVFHADDKDKPLAKAITNDLLMQPLVRYYAGQLQAVKLDYAQHKEALDALGVTETPALLILKKDGTRKTVLQGAKGLQLRKVVSGLKSVAPNKKKPW
jgi:predicted esterase